MHESKINTLDTFIRSDGLVVDFQDVGNLCSIHLKRDYTRQGLQAKMGA